MRYSVLSFILVFSLIFSLPGFKSALADIISLKDGGETLNGKIMNETDTEITVKLKTGGTARFPKSWIKDIKKEEIPDKDLYTAQDIYFEKYKNADPKDAKVRLGLAEWCLKNSAPGNNLADMAIRHFNIAKGIDPEITKEASSELLGAYNKEPEKLYKVLESEFNKEEYFNSERLILSIISAYPESDYAKDAKDLLVKIWGRARADKILNAKDGLPKVALSGSSLSLILSHFGDEKVKEMYLAKCMDKANDYEERAKEVAKEKQMGYYEMAMICHNTLLYSDKSDVKGSAKAKINKLLKTFFESNPIPRDEAKFREMVGYLNIVEDKVFVAKIADRYFKIGKELYKKAKKLRQPDKGQKAQDAFFCFSLAKNFSNDEKIRQSAADLIPETQRLERARR